MCTYMTNTDLKVDNILVGFEDPAVLEDFAILQASNPMPCKMNDGRTVFLSHNDFGAVRSYRILPRITDFGLAHRQTDPSLLNRHPIEPDRYRAPEVILGAGWTYSADIWNLGLLVKRKTLHIVLGSGTNLLASDVEYARVPKSIHDAS